MHCPALHCPALLAATAAIHCTAQQPLIAAVRTIYQLSKLAISEHTTHSKTICQQQTLCQQLSNTNAPIQTMLSGTSQAHTQPRTPCMPQGYCLAHNQPATAAAQQQQHLHLTAQPAATAHSQASSTAALPKPSQHCYERSCCCCYCLCPADCQPYCCHPQVLVSSQLPVAPAPGTAHSSVPSSGKQRLHKLQQKR